MSEQWNLNNNNDAPAKNEISEATTTWTFEVTSKKPTDERDILLYVYLTGQQVTIYVFL